MEHIVWVAQILSTFLMTGIILFVQIVHYPLFRLASGQFHNYHQQHMKRTTWVVLPIMVTELGTAMLLALLIRPGGFMLTNLFLLIGIWAMTFFVQVPLHKKLSHGFNPKTIQLLVRSNWVRALLWVARSATLIAIL